MSPRQQHARPDRPATPAAAAPGVDVGALYHQHAASVARWAARLAGPAFDVEDLVHEVFLVACRRLCEFRGDAKVTTWLYEITLRVVRDRRRRQRRWSWVGGGGWGRGAAPEPAAARLAEVPSAQPSALDLLERREAGARLYQVLDLLPEAYRTALILFELEGMSGEEIAVVTGTSLSNVWVRLFRGRQLFMKRLARRERRDGT